MENIVENKLNESKERLPVSFITDFISNGWEEVGILKADIEAIKAVYSGTSEIANLIQNLIDSYLICIGQMEAHLHEKDYLEFPEDSKLNESVDIHIEGNDVVIADNSGEAVASIPVDSEKEIEEVPETHEGQMEFLAKDEDEAIEGYDKVIEKTDNEHLAGELEHIRDEEQAHKDFLEIAKENPDAEYEHDEHIEAPKTNEAFDFFVDFDDPVDVDPLTEEEIIKQRNDLLN